MSSDARLKSAGTVIVCTVLPLSDVTPVFIIGYVPSSFTECPNKSWTSPINPSLTFAYPFFLLSCTLRFSFAALCTTNFSRFWFFWMASFCTLVVHKYHPRICSARCKASCRPPLQGHWWLPWWQPSAWIAFGQSPSKSMSLRFAWVCIVWCWLSSMKAGRERGGHQTGRPSCDVSDAGSDRSSTDGWYYEKLHIIPTNGSSSIFT